MRAWTRGRGRGAHCALRLLAAQGVKLCPDARSCRSALRRARARAAGGGAREGAARRAGAAGRDWAAGTQYLQRREGSFHYSRFSSQRMFPPGALPEAVRAVGPVLPRWRLFRRGGAPPGPGAGWGACLGCVRRPRRRSPGSAPAGSLARRAATARASLRGGAFRAGGERGGARGARCKRAAGPFTARRWPALLGRRSRRDTAGDFIRICGLLRAGTATLRELIGWSVATSCQRALAGRVQTEVDVVLVAKDAPRAAGALLSARYQVAKSPPFAPGDAPRPSAPSRPAWSVPRRATLATLPAVSRKSTRFKPKLTTACSATYRQTCYHSDSA